MGTASPRGRSAAAARALAQRRRRALGQPLAALRHAVSSAPLTSVYTLVLLVTTVVLRQAPTHVAHDLLVASSTDVAHLERDPVTVIVLSATWLPGKLWLPYALVLMSVCAPLERRVGTARAALVFVSGHVLATLLTELPIAVAIAATWLPSASAHRLDVGASYGMLAAVAASLGGLPPLRGLVLLVLLMLTGVLMAGVPVGPPDLSTYGHALSVAIGVCWWPTLYDRIPWRRGHPRPSPGA
jgi:hypothetical protein